MTWIRSSIKTVQLLVLVLVCMLGFYNLSVRSQQLPPAPEDKEDKGGALTIVNTDEQNENGTQEYGVEIVEIDEEIVIENPEVFLPTKEWQKIKPGQAIPRGLHVRLNIETGEREAKLLDEADGGGPTKDDAGSKRDKPQGSDQGIKFDELKRAVKTLKSEKFKNVDMETLKREKNLRSFTELKADMDSVQAGVKTDMDMLPGMVEELQSISHNKEEILPLLSVLEVLLHQIDNAIMFCDLGAMPTLLKCLNSTLEEVRSKAALTLGAAMQSNPKVQVSVMEHGGMTELLRLLAFDPVVTVRKRALHALSTMVRNFPFAQRRFLGLGGLSVLKNLLEDKLLPKLQVQAVTLLADLVDEKSKHMEHSDSEDPTLKERLRQYEQVNIQGSVQEAGWCSAIPALLGQEEHDGLEKVLVAMETLLSVCRHEFVTCVPTLRKLHRDYETLLQEELEAGEGDDGYFKAMVSLLFRLMAQLQVVREEL